MGPDRTFVVGDDKQVPIFFADTWPQPRESIPWQDFTSNGKRRKTMTGTWIPVSLPLVSAVY